MDINILLIIVILVTVFKIADGFKRGVVKEIISLVSLIILGTVAALLAYGIGSYNDGKFFNVVIVIILLALLGILHHLLSVVFFSAKLVSKLPVVSFVNKLLGAVFGVLEVVFVLWVVYTLVMMLNMGSIGEVILSLTQESKLLSWLYRNNWLAYGIQRALEEFQFIPLPLL